MKMDHAYALEKALHEHDAFGTIGRAIHIDKYPEPNPNKNPENRDPYHGIVGFRFEVPGTDNIDTAFAIVRNILETTIGKQHSLVVVETNCSRLNVPNKEPPTKRATDGFVTSYDPC